LKSTAGEAHLFIGLTQRRKSMDWTTIAFIVAVIVLGAGGFYFMRHTT
jgi:hypothetical protein